MQVLITLQYGFILPRPSREPGGQPGTEMVNFAVVDLDLRRFKKKEKRWIWKTWENYGFQLFSDTDSQVGITAESTMAAF